MGFRVVRDVVVYPDTPWRMGRRHKESEGPGFELSLSNLGQGALGNLGVPEPGLPFSADCPSRVPSDPRGPKLTPSLNSLALTVKFQRHKKNSIREAGAERRK